MLVSELIEETRAVLLSGARDERNKLAVGITPTATSLTLVYPLNQIQRGSKISIGLEDMYVWGTSSLTLSPIDRGQFGSTAFFHDAGATVAVNPKFSNSEIFRAINSEIYSWASPSNGLYRVGTLPLEYNPVVSGYAIPTQSVQDIYEVRYEVPGPSKEWPLSRDWELVRDMGSEFGTTTPNVLILRDAFPNRSVLIKAKFVFAPLTETLTASTNTNLIPDNYLDIITVGAAMRLASPREVRRNFTEVQGDTRRAEEVPPGAILGGARELARFRRERINEEAAKLTQQYPYHSPRYPFYIN